MTLNSLEKKLDFTILKICIITISRKKKKFVNIVIYLILYLDLKEDGWGQTGTSYFINLDWNSFKKTPVTLLHKILTLITKNIYIYLDYISKTYP